MRLAAGAGTSRTAPAAMDTTYNSAEAAHVASHADSSRGLPDMPQRPRRPEGTALDQLVHCTSRVRRCTWWSPRTQTQHRPEKLELAVEVVMVAMAVGMALMVAAVVATPMMRLGTDL